MNESKSQASRQLPDRELARRIERVQAALTRRRLDALLVFDRANTFYLTGLRCSLSYLLITRREAVFWVDGRYIAAARAAVAHCDVRLMKDPRRDLERGWRQLQPRRVGFEGSVPWETFNTWKESFPGTDWSESGGLLQKLRIVKSPHEVRAIEHSARLNDEVFERVVKSVSSEGAGRPATEWDLRAAIRTEADRAGAEGLSFESIVAVGEMSARPHYATGHRPLEAGRLLLIDMGLLVDGYCSDMTRTLGLGRPAIPRLMKAYEALLVAQEAALAEVGPGVACADLDRIARDRLAARRLARYFTHGLGHGVGLEIHEPPVLNARSKDVLRAGMVVTIEPGVYLPGLGGIRIEDLVLVTRSGHRVLSRTPKAWRVLPMG